MACELSDFVAWQSQARKIVETRAWKDVSEEDLPLTLFQQPRQKQDLVRILIAACSFDTALNVDRVLGAWRVSGRYNKVVIGPAGAASMPKATAEWLRG